MVTGDGGGYLNIPSEYFHVAQSDLQLESFVPQENGIAQVIQTETCALQIQPAYDFLPTRLLLDLNRYSGPSGPGLITFTFKFNGGFSRLHNQSIELKGRSTVFEIETSGTCRGCRIAAAKDWGGGLQGRLLRPPTAKMGG